MPITIITTNTTNSGGSLFTPGSSLTPSELMRQQLRRDQEVDEQWREMTRRAFPGPRSWLGLRELILLVLLDDEPTGPSELLGCAPATVDEVFRMVVGLDRRREVFTVGEVKGRCVQLISDGELRWVDRPFAAGEELGMWPPVDRVGLTVRGLAVATEYAVRLRLVDDTDEVPT